MGIVLRGLQWVANPSLWNDELLLVSNVLSRGIVDLVFRPLDYGQVAPVGFLALEKLAVLLVGMGEHALRLIPLLGSIVALVLFARLARAIFEPLGAFIATAAFALNPFLISLAGLAKHYAFDVLATVLLLVALRYLIEERASLRAKLGVAVGAGLAGFLSIPSVLIAAPAIAAWAFATWRSEGGRASLRVAAFLPGLVWGVVALSAALGARVLLSGATGELMDGFWSARTAFAPPLTQYPTWFLERFGTTVLPELLLRPYFGRPSALEPLWNLLGSSPALLGLLGAVAVVALARFAGGAWAIALVLAVALAVGFSRLTVYPLDTRTSVYLLPPVLLLFGALAELLRQAVPGTERKVTTAIGAIALLPLAAVLVEHAPPYGVQPTRELFREVAERVPPGDPLAADVFTRFAAGYYGEWFDLRTDRVHVPESFGASERIEFLNQLRGEPSVWVLFTLPEDRSTVLCHLDRIGTEREAIALSYGELMPAGSLHRYDLSGAPASAADATGARGEAGDTGNPPEPCPDHPIEVTEVGVWDDPGRGP